MLNHSVTSRPVVACERPDRLDRLNNAVNVLFVGDVIRWVPIMEFVFRQFLAAVWMACWTRVRSYRVDNLSRFSVRSPVQ